MKYHIKFIVSLLILYAIILSCGNKETVNKDTVKLKEQTIDYESDFERGKSYYNDGDYDMAIKKFELIKNTDTNYTKAQELIKKSKELQVSKNKEQKEKEFLKTKYEKICKSGGYQYELESKLHDLGFKQYDSGFEKSTDGSTQVATYYQKYEPGHNIKIKLIGSYDIKSFYYTVTVE